MASRREPPWEHLRHEPTRVGGGSNLTLFTIWSRPEPVAFGPGQEPESPEILGRCYLEDDEEYGIAVTSWIMWKPELDEAWKPHAEEEVVRH